MSDEDDRVVLRYAWEEGDYPAYRQVVAMYWQHQPAPVASGRKAPSIGWQYARYYGIPSLVTLAVISLWSWLMHRSFWPQTRLTWLGEVGDSPAFILSSYFPSAAEVALAVAAGMLVLSLLDQWLPRDPPDEMRHSFETHLGIPYEVRLHQQGFDVAGPRMTGTYYWQLPYRRPLPASLSEDGRHVLIVHPFMLLVIPARAIPSEPGALLARVIALRDSAATAPAE